MFQRSFLRVGVLGTAFSLSLTAAAAPKIQEEIVGPAVGSGVSYMVSPRGVRLASVGPKGSRVIVTVDGVESQPFEQMLTAAGQPYYGPQSGIDTRGQAAAVVFSNDGTRYAYCARTGNEAVVVVDSKEVARLPNNPSLFAFGPLTFSPGGKHFYYVAWDQPTSKKTFFMDGKALPMVPEGDPETNTPAAVYFSPDDSRYYYYSAKADQPNRPLAMVIDGADAGYVGLKARFTADGKQIYSTSQTAPLQLLVDGKPALPGTTIERFALSRTGNKVIAVAVRPNPGGQLYYLMVDGKKVDSSECIGGIDRIVFSPDGKRYAARCKGLSSAWVVLDGAKGQEYNGIADEMTFSPDSSKFVYVAGNAGRTFVIQDGVESNGYDMVFTKPIFSPDGKRMGYIAGANRLNLETVIDGKVVSKMPDASIIKFSPDSSRYAAMAVGMGNGAIVDGAELTGFGGSDLDFSPDGKHLRLVGQRQKDQANGLFIDNELIYKQNGRFTRLPVFSPDSNHIYWSMVELDQSVQPPRRTVVYVDGVPVGKWNADLNAPMETTPQIWNVSQEGVLTFIMATPEGMKRYKVTPDAATTVASIISDAKAAQAKAIADAEAAKAKAAQDAAQAKADAEAARLKQQQDAQKAREDALAARQKAQQEAAAAKLKAQQDAAAARAARRGGAPARGQ